MTAIAMTNRPFNIFPSTSFGSAEGRDAGRTNPRQGMSRLATIESKHPNLDTELGEARQTLEEIKDSDTLGGLKWYEWLALPVLPLVLSGNKQMIREQKSLVASLEALSAERDDLRAVLGAPVDRFEIS